MVEVRWTHPAVQDLEAAAKFIARDSRQYARLFVAEVFKSADRLAQFPRAGRVVPEFRDPCIREFILGPYRLVYRIARNRAIILTLFHGARLLKTSRIRKKRA